MARRTNIDEYNKLTKEQLIELAKSYGRLALTLDGLWFLGVERTHGIETAIQLDEDVWRQFGKSEAKVIKKFLGINEVTTVEDIAKIFLLTPMFGANGAIAETKNGKCILSVADCHPQKARIKKNMGEFPCKSVGVAYFEGFLGAMNNTIMFKCAVCPPDEHPDNLWCEWEVWFQQEQLTLPSQAL
jgi:hypothetical protein